MSKEDFLIEDWKHSIDVAIQSLRPFGIQEAYLYPVAKACKNIEIFNKFVRLLYQYHRQHGPRISPLDRLIKLANDSSFDLSDWMSTINFFSVWLHENKRKQDLGNMLEYLNCMIRGPDCKDVKIPMVEVLGITLEQFGYKGID